jgi:hypothetical protein
LREELDTGPLALDFRRWYAVDADAPMWFVAGPTILNITIGHLPPPRAHGDPSTPRGDMGMRRRHRSPR